MITRFYTLAEKVKPGKITILYGPRRVGKTVMLREYIDTISPRPTLYTGEDIRIQEILNSQDLNRILALVE